MQPKSRDHEQILWQFVAGRPAPDVQPFEPEDIVAVVRWNIAQSRRSIYGSAIAGAIKLMWGLTTGSKTQVRRSPMRLISIVASIAGLLMVASCTDEELERATVGGAVGTAVGEIVYDKPLEGFVAGAVVGAVSADN